MAWLGSTFTSRPSAYQLGSRISPKQVRDFRGAVPERAQASFITTAKFAKKAREEAQRPGYKRIALIDGEQLVDILVEEYDNLPADLRDSLALKKVLVPE